MSIIIDDLDAFLSTCNLSVEDRILARDLFFEHLGDSAALAKAWQAEPSLQAIGEVYGWGNLTLNDAQVTE